MLHGLLVTRVFETHAYLFDSSYAPDTCARAVIGAMLMGRERGVTQFWLHHCLRYHGVEGFSRLYCAGERRKSVFNERKSILPIAFIVGKDTIRSQPLGCFHHKTVKQGMLF
jgi:hypothetical protein